jgi:hypothetical protein
MSLFDMINFLLADFGVAYKAIAQEIVFAGSRANTDDPLSEADRQRINDNLSWVSDVSRRLNLAHANARLSRTIGALRQFDSFPISYSQMYDQLLVLKEAVDDDIRAVQLYRYPPHKALALLSINDDWAATIKAKAFPSARSEIDAGVDCYALEHNTACVFHMMRVAEHGLRALARSLRVSFPKSGTPIEWAQWQDLIDQIRSEGKKAADALPKGPKRDAARDFYSGAVHHFEGLKDKYRNAVMHLRASYDELDALRAITQVRDFMNGLSVKIGEKTRQPIRRWP